MNDDRSYDQIEGPDRNAIRYENVMKELAEKGHKQKVKHMRKPYAYSSFDGKEAKKGVKFDQVISREKAMEQLIKVPEGAPFWKYYVRDAVLSKPVRSYSISQNPENSHTYTAPQPKEAKNPEDFNCGKIHKRL